MELFPSSMTYSNKIGIVKKDYSFREGIFEANIVILVLLLNMLDANMYG